MTCKQLSIWLLITLATSKVDLSSSEDTDPDWKADGSTDKDCHFVYHWYTIATTVSRTSCSNWDCFMRRCSRKEKEMYLPLLCSVPECEVTYSKLMRKKEDWLKMKSVETTCIHTCKAFLSNIAKSRNSNTPCSCFQNPKGYQATLETEVFLLQYGEKKLQQQSMQQKSVVSRSVSIPAAEMTSTISELERQNSELRKIKESTSHASQPYAEEKLIRELRKLKEYTSDLFQQYDNEKCVKRVEGKGRHSEESKQSHWLPFSWGGCDKCKQKEKEIQEKDEEIRRMAVQMNSDIKQQQGGNSADALCLEFDSFFTDLLETVNDDYMPDASALMCSTFQQIYSEMVQGVLSCFEQLFVVDKRNRDSQLLRAATNGYAKFLSVAELPQPSPVGVTLMIEQGRQYQLDMKSYINKASGLAWKLVTAVPPIIVKCDEQKYNPEVHDRTMDWNKHLDHYDLIYTRPVFYVNYTGSKMQKGYVYNKKKGHK